MKVVGIVAAMSTSDNRRCPKCDLPFKRGDIITMSEVQGGDVLGWTIRRVAHAECNARPN